VVVKASAICFGAALIGVALANGVSTTMKRLVYNRSGKSFRVFSRQLVQEYRALYGQDRNYWAYCFSMLDSLLGMLGFMIFPK
jgi:hypothetical protein